MLAAVDSGAVVGALIGLGGAVLGGGLTMAYRLGALTNTVNRLVTDQAEHRRHHESEEAKREERDRVITTLANLIHHPDAED